ncbi:ribonuclease T2 [Amylibacter sp. IMCC11727]|uniref:ribonuclease T2 n=1 Tax=Amylibacter sp. IMCC11727 TaxID=3039851 RepID=UPI00244DC98E|nr:ribonuclease T2 [Amylibacter sp. IMCC11727]WGI22757.1 ribonuclease T2 [Amylibacter sp. IMCC11727]
MIRIFLSALLLGSMAHADGENPGQFDYYVMALSWSPNWCALEGDSRKADQCHPRHDHGWILHGLWPQFESGWPSFCRANERAPSRAMTAAMADIMGSGGLAWHQWKKHGTCSGLSATEYYTQSRAAYGAINRPEILRKLDKTIALPASVIEAAFLEANPTLQADQITITCKQNHIQEARICLTKEFEFRRCGRDAIRDCKATKATLNPIR